jgi:hypothetical protein
VDSLLQTPIQYKCVVLEKNDCFKLLTTETNFPAIYGEVIERTITYSLNIYCYFLGAMCISEELHNEEVHDLYTLRSIITGCVRLN